MLFILEHLKCPWQCVYTSRDEQAMITLTGFDMGSFHDVLTLFAPVNTVDSDDFIVKQVAYQELDQDS
jgi:hypothetical protein